ncbi:hypothetical protein P171DRAFT_491091 [Karstenula rhodostoma CBS 690.94]|uniref:DUF7730 domain-containing protein n=1 Tax=Karstenula rhodostoma CBS 690.94 TaxID=1392251 RepID=A0A9P4P6R4_9PLEO|nr:hypothetical protein P171DRAFT_491091 [Karstenula rhodostoma CBS 690.94]
MEEPYGGIKDTKLQYYAYRWPTLFTGLNLLLCPFTCGRFDCWITPEYRPPNGMIYYHGPPVNERMSDMHFVRQGRKLRRRNSLSIEKPVGKIRQTLKILKKPFNQHLSPLFAKLPYEIRIQIYEKALSDTGAVCIYTAPITDDWDSFHKLRAADGLLHLGIQPSPQYMTRISSGLMGRIESYHLSIALLQTCRLLYSEALPLLYSYNQFVFNDPRRLVALSHSIPRTHFEHIRSIWLDCSKLGWRTYGPGPNRGYYMRTFVTPSLVPIQEFLCVIRILRELRSIYILFSIRNDDSRPRVEIGWILKDFQEYHGKIRGATYTRCKAHLLVYVWPELVHHNTERGLIEMEGDVRHSHTGKKATG